MPFRSYIDVYFSLFPLSGKRRGHVVNLQDFIYVNIYQEKTAVCIRARLGPLGWGSQPALVLWCSLLRLHFRMARINFLHASRQDQQALGASRTHRRYELKSAVDKVMGFGDMILA